jgi:hypothetical protein
MTSGDDPAQFALETSGTHRSALAGRAARCEDRNAATRQPACAASVAPTEVLTV